MKTYVKRIKRQATDWEKNICKTQSDKGLASRIYKELSKVNSQKLGKRYEQTLHQRGYTDGK